MFVAYLDWVRPADGNYKLCRRLKKVIQNILNRILETTVTQHLEGSNQPSSTWESIGTSQLGPAIIDPSEADWMSLLNTMDWTQGFGTEITF